LKLHFPVFLLSFAGFVTAAQTDTLTSAVCADYYGVPDDGAEGRVKKTVIHLK
jgi:hypothetical protein